LLSTVGDYLQFARLLLNDGELGDTRLIGRATAELMRSVFVPDSMPGRSAGEGFGLGVRVITSAVAHNSLLSDGSFGWSGVYNTHFFVDPEERVIGMFMAQVAASERRFLLREDFETAVMQALVDE
jgi:CubicO group peptidase (beta-lactamase class C family)